MSPPSRRYQDEVAVLASMHGKERVIGPILHEELGLVVGLAMGVDTDQFGAFSHEVERTGSQLDAARAKIAAGFDYAPLARVGVASEGSFGPHPQVPFLAIGRELVLLVDRENHLELAGCDTSVETNFGHAVVQDIETALAFARRSGFPEHGLIVVGCRDGQPAPDLFLDKNVTNAAALEGAVRQALARCGSVFVETDMRAHRNPTRMAAIGRATRDLVRLYFCRCPLCDHPGFDVTQRIPGLPCAWCGEPTRTIVADVLSCRSCGHSQSRPASTFATADPGRCDGCNP